MKKNDSEQMRQVYFFYYPNFNGTLVNKYNKKEELKKDERDVLINYNRLALNSRIKLYLSKDTAVFIVNEGSKFSFKKLFFSKIEFCDPYRLLSILDFSLQYFNFFLLFYYIKCEFLNFLQQYFIHIML